MAIGIDGRDNLGIVRGLHGERRAPVEGFLCREHAGAPVGERGEFQRILVGLRTGVDEEELVVVVAGEASEPFRQFHLQRVDHRVGVEAESVQLVVHLFYIVGMGVADGNHRVAAIEVEVFLSFVVPHATALSFDDVHIEQGIDIKEFHFLFPFLYIYEY